MANQLSGVRTALDNAAAQSAAGEAPRNTMLVDSRLIVQISQRDEQALGTLYDRYGALVYTIALRSAQDPALAETIVQDVFHALWHLASSFQVGTSVPAWLIGMARRRAIEVTQIRRASTGMHKKTQPEKRTIRNHKQGERIADTLPLSGLLDALSASQRETVELAYYDGLTCREIATRLNEPVSTIKAHLREGLRTIYEHMGSAAESPDKRNNGQPNAAAAGDDL